MFNLFYRHYHILGKGLFPEFLQTSRRVCRLHCWDAYHELTLFGTCGYPSPLPP